MISADVEGVDQLRRALEGDLKRLPKEISIAVNATSKKVRTDMSRQIREELAAKASDVKRSLKIRKKANKQHPDSIVGLAEEKRLSLKAFGARQTRKGVTYKTSRKQGRKLVEGAFMGPRPGVKAPRLNGHAFKRRGQNRTPIVKLMGASPWGAYVKNRMRPITVRQGAKELEKQLLRRVRFIELKRQGVIK